MHRRGTARRPNKRSENSWSYRCASDISSCVHRTLQPAPSGDVRSFSHENRETSNGIGVKRRIFIRPEIPWNKENRDIKTSRTLSIDQTILPEFHRKFDSAANNRRTLCLASASYKLGRLKARPLARGAAAEAFSPTGKRCSNHSRVSHGRLAVLLNLHQ